MTNWITQSMGILALSVFLSTGPGTAKHIISAVRSIQGFKDNQIIQRKNH